MSKTPITILGIDPGTAITGYGVIAYLPHKTEPIDYGCIRPPQTFSLHERYLILYEALEALIEKHKPRHISIESQFVYKNAQSALKLGMAKGMAILAATKKHIPIYEYAPKQAKLAVVGRGSATKEQVQKMLQILLHLPGLPTPEDAADALALAICHAHHMQFQHTLTTRLAPCTNISKAPS